MQCSGRSSRKYSSVIGRGEAKLYVVGGFLVDPLHLDVVDNDDGLHGFLQFVELQQSTGRFLHLGRVVEVDGFSWRYDPIFSSPFRRVESVVAVPVVVLEGVGSVGQLMWLPDVLDV